MADYLPAETRYVVFSDSHVRVENHSEAEIHSDITDLFGAMIRSEPIGTETLRLALYRRHHKILLIDPTAAACEFDTVGEATNAFFHRIIQALMRAKPKLLWLHAGAAAREGRALLFLGPSRSGKSTLVTELTRTGWHYLSDEVAPVDPHARTVMPFPLTPLVRKPGRAARYAAGHSCLVRAFARGAAGQDFRAEAVVSERSAYAAAPLCVLPA